MGAREHRIMAAVCILSHWRLWHFLIFGERRGFHCWWWWQQQQQHMAAQEDNACFDCHIWGEEMAQFGESGWKRCVIGILDIGMCVARCATGLTSCWVWTLEEWWNKGHHVWWTSIALVFQIAHVPSTTFRFILENLIPYLTCIFRTRFEITKKQYVLRIKFSQLIPWMSMVWPNLWLCTVQVRLIHLDQNSEESLQKLSLIFYREVS